MYDQSREDILYMVLYGAAAMLSLTAFCYLLFSRSNAFAPDITSPVHLRRWTATFFAAMTLSHLWYLPIPFLISNDDVKLGYLVGALLDYLTLMPLAIIVLFTMLQDRRRPLWPVAMMTAPPVVIMTWCVVSRSDTLLPMLYAYLLLLSVCLIIYMVRAVRQYGRWLRDNYADLEHKEVWQSLVVLTIILLVFGIYAIGAQGPVSQYVFEINDIVLVCYLLWRVETLSDLSISQQQSLPADLRISVNEGSDVSPKILTDNIGPLLQKYCIDTHLYLQHDLSLSQLAKTIGTNRFYLSQYFSSQGLSYNTYINNLRINHFISLYREAVAAQRSFTVQQLSQESGFRSYTTFGTAFKYKMGQSVRSWMKATSEAKK